MVIVKIPGEEFAVNGHGAFHFDDASGAKIGPGEFFFAGPNDFDRAARGARQASGFDGSVAGVLSAVRRAGVGDDHANGVFGNAEDVGEFTADAEGTLRASADGQLVAGPLGDGGARLERSMRDVGDGVSGVETTGGAS